MEVGKLYKTKDLYWILYPSKDIADLVAADAALARHPAAAAATTAAYWSKRLNNNVSYIAQNSMFMLLEQDGMLSKVLSTEGMVGWIYLALWCKDDIMEVKAE
jgi:hypothetical protein